MSKTIDGRQMIVGCPSLQTTCMIAVLLRSPSEIPAVAKDVAIIKELKVCIVNITFWGIQVLCFYISNVHLDVTRI